MHFHPNKNTDAGKSQQHNYSKNDIDLAYDFAKIVHKEFGHFLKAIVLFGSKAKHPEKTDGDVDILLVIDDITYNLTAEIVESYRLMIESAIIKVSKRIHVTTLKFTSFWDYIRVGDPVGLNILRDGVALIDTGFFTPMQMLLYSGKVRPSEEAMLNYLSRSPQAIFNSKWHIMQATLDLYWAVIDSAHAAIMKIGELPPSPSEIAKVLEYKVVVPYKLKRNLPKTMDLFYKVSKDILHKKTKNISGKEYDHYLKLAEEFVDEMKIFVKKKL